MIDENFQKQADIFLENDPHAKDILTLFDCIVSAYAKLRPALQGVTQERYESGLNGVRRDIAEYLGNHMERRTKELNNTQNN